MLCNGVSTWASKVQRSVATSTTGSEYLLMSKTAKMSQWIAKVLKDMGYAKYISPTPTKVDTSEEERLQQSIFGGDNQGIIALVKTPHLHVR